MAVLLPLLAEGAVRGQALACILWGLYRLRIELSPTSLVTILRAVRKQAGSLRGEEGAIAAWAVSGLWMNSRRGALSTEPSGCGLGASVVRRRGRRLRARLAVLASQRQVGQHKGSPPQNERKHQGSNQLGGNPMFFSQVSQGRGSVVSQVDPTTCRDSVETRSAVPKPIVLLLKDCSQTRRVKRLRSLTIFRKCLLALLLPLPGLHGYSSSLKTPQSQHSVQRPISVSGLAMVASSLTKPGRDAPVPSDELIGWILATARIHSD